MEKAIQLREQSHQQEPVLNIDPKSHKQTVIACRSCSKFRDDIQAVTFSSE